MKYLLITENPDHTFDVEEYDSESMKNYGLVQSRRQQQFILAFSFATLNCSPNLPIFVANERLVHMIRGTKENKEEILDHLREVARNKRRTER